jgi:hypothetical protein
MDVMGVGTASLPRPSHPAQSVPPGEKDSLSRKTTPAPFRAIFALEIA